MSLLKLEIENSETCTPVNNIQYTIQYLEC